MTGFALPRRGLRVAVAAAAALTLSLALAMPASADVSDTPARTWGTNGRVLAILSSGGRVYVAGTFSAVIDTSGKSHPAANIAVFDPTAGTFDPTWKASADTTVNALAVSGGTLYIGGLFAVVDGVARHKLAALNLMTGTLVSAWKPGVDSQVDQVTVVGSKVYASGNFSVVTDNTGTYAQPFIARFDATTGALDQSWKPAPDGRVRTVLGSSDGTRIFIGGDFLSVNGAPLTTSIASLVTTTGAVDPVFRPGPNNGNQRAPVYDLATDGTRLIIGAAGGGGACTAVDATHGTAIWMHHTNGNLQSVRIIGSIVYCGGHFNGSGSFDGFDRNKLASVDLATGTVFDWAPKVNSALGIWSMGADDTHLYAGGDFTKISGVNQSHFAMFSDVGTQSVPLPPQSPVAQGGDDATFVAWAPPASDGGAKVTTYRIFRGVGTAQLKMIGTAKSTTFTDSKVVNGTTYTYAIAALNSVGQSALSSPATVTPKKGAVTAPGAPTGAAATSLPGTIHLTWNPPGNSGGSPVTGYQVMRSTSTGTETLLATLGNVTSYDDSAVVVQVRYFYTVLAVNSVGPGLASNEASAAPNSGVPSIPVLAGTVSGGKITLTWTAPADNGSPITKYSLVRDAIRIGNPLATDTSYVDTTVAHGTTYKYQLKAINAVGASKYSNTVMLTVP